MQNAKRHFKQLDLFNRLDSENSTPPLPLPLVPPIKQSEAYNKEKHSTPLQLPKRKGLVNSVLFDNVEYSYWNYETLPNGFFNKTLTGFGATHTAITNPLNYIIFVPTLSLLNKFDTKERRGKVLLIKGGQGSTIQKQQRILDFIQLCTASKTPFKIVATYDQANIFNTLIRDPKTSPLFTTTHYLLDEYHNFETASIYRGFTIYALFRSLLSVLPKERTTLVTATPPLQLTKSLKKIGFETTIVNLKNPLKYTLNTYVCEKQGHLLFNVIEQVKEQVKQGKNVYLFTNLLGLFHTQFKELQKTLNLNGINYIVSDSKTLKLGINPTDNIGKNDTKQLNIITCKGFEGIDIEDPNAVVFFTTIGTQKYSQLDYNSIIQAFGRFKGKTKPLEAFFYLSKANNYVSKSEQSEYIEQLKTKKRYGSTLNRINQKDSDGSTYFNEFIAINLIKQIDTNNKYCFIDIHFKGVIKPYESEGIDTISLDFKHHTPTSGAIKVKKENSFNDLMKIYLQAQPLTETTKRKLIDSDPIFLDITNNNLKKEDLGTCKNENDTYNKTKILELINNLKTYYNDLTRLYNYLKGLRTKKEGKTIAKYRGGASIPINEIKDDIKALILKYNLQIDLKPLNAFKVLFEYSEKRTRSERLYKVLGSTHVSQTKY